MICKKKFLGECTKKKKKKNFCILLLYSRFNTHSFKCFFLSKTIVLVNEHILDMNYYKNIQVDVYLICVKIILSQFDFTQT